MLTTKKVSRSRTAKPEQRPRPRWSRRPSKKAKVKKTRRRDDPEEKAISPSQIATFRECERKWAYDKIDRLPRKPNKYAQIGTDTHKELERWLELGKPPRAKTLAGRIALAGLHALPEPGIAVTEYYVRFRYKGVLYHGYVDGFWEHINRPVLFVHDHKTTGDFRWAKTAEELLVDPQMAIYSFGLLLVYPKHEAVVGRWQYHLRRPTPTKSGYKHRTRLVELKQTRAQIEQHMEGIHETGLRIVQARSEPASARPKNFTHCKAYGGCDYIETCHRGVSPRDKFRGIVAHKTRSKAVEMLKKRMKKTSLPIIDVDAVREAKKPRDPKRSKKDPRQMELSLEEKKAKAKTTKSEMTKPKTTKSKTTKSKVTKTKVTKSKVTKPAPKSKAPKTKKKPVWKMTSARVGYRAKGNDTLLKVKYSDGTSQVITLEGVSPEDIVRG